LGSVDDQIGTDPELEAMSMNIQVIEGDITKLQVDAIVNAGHMRFAGSIVFGLPTITSCASDDEPKTVLNWRRLIVTVRLSASDEGRQTPPVWKR
jgi:hypothetical protein